MRVEREIAGVAFPFAAGVIAAVLSGGSPCIIKPTYHTMALAGTLLSAVLLLHPSRRCWDVRLQWCIISCCALACGALIGISATEMGISDVSSDGWLSSMALRIGKQTEEIIDSIGFKDRSTNAVIKALLTGNRSDIPPDISADFRDSGASHILALSGLHLGIIYGIFSRILSCFGNGVEIRRARSVLIMLACGLYTLATGAGPSITRAYLFIVLKEIAGMAGRDVSLKSLLAAALMLHLAFDPTAASSVGFQLSYAAMLGIAFIFPYLRDIWKNGWKLLGWIWKSAALSISCQITTGPLAYHYFGTFPHYFLMTNLLALPLAGLIIPMALLTTVLTSFGWCPEFIVTSTEWFTQAMLNTLSIISSM